MCVQEQFLLRDRYFKNKPKLRFKTDQLGLEVEMDHFQEEGLYLEITLWPLAFGVPSDIRHGAIFPSGQLLAAPLFAVVQGVGHGRV